MGSKEDWQAAALSSLCMHVEELASDKLGVDVSQLSGGDNVFVSSGENGGVNTYTYRMSWSEWWSQHTHVLRFITTCSTFVSVFAISSRFEGESCPVSECS